MSMNEIFDPNDPSLIGDQFGVPGVDDQQIAQQVAQAMAGLGKRVQYDNLGADPMGRPMFDPSNPNAAQALANQGQVPQTAPVPGNPQGTPPPPPQQQPPQQQPSQTSPQTGQAPEQSSQPSAPEGVDEELWQQWLAQAANEQSSQQPSQQSPQQPSQQTGDQPVQQQPTTPATQPPAPSESGVPASGIDIDLGGQQYHLDQDQVTYLLQVNSWLEQQPNEVKQQWAAIQSGESVAMSRQEVEQLRQMQQTARFRQQSPAAQAQALQNEPDLELLDDETANYIRDLQSRLQQQPVQQQPAPTQDAPPQFQPQGFPQQSTQQPVEQPDQQAIYQAASRQAQRDQANRQVVDTTVDQYRQQYGLTDEQVEHLTRSVAQSQMVPVLANRYAVRSPLDNSVIQEAPFDRVVNEAFSMAMATDPDLQTIHNDYIFNQRLAAENSANQRVAAKRGKAGSLAASPSAAVPAGEHQGLPPIGPGNQMNLPAMSAAIASAIEQAQSAG